MIGGQIYLSQTSEVAQLGRDLVQLVVQHAEVFQSAQTQRKGKKTQVTPSAYQAENIITAQNLKQHKSVVVPFNLCWESLNVVMVQIEHNEVP